MAISLAVILEQLDPVSLGELDQAQLHDRIESKVLLTHEHVATAIDALADDYLVLDHDAARMQTYVNVYFDSADLQNYHDHHNQNGRRIKVRYRTYANSDITYFEIKRTVHGRTVKARRRSSAAQTRLHQCDAAFLYRHTQRRPSLLAPSLQSGYDRILLVKRDFSERVTIDLNLSFDNGEVHVTTPQLAICEFKQPRLDRRSPAMEAVQRGPETFSKYCMGLASCDPTLPRNRFKKVFRSLDRLGASRQHRAASTRGATC